MFKTKTINVSKSKGIVTVEIRGRSATAGSFASAIETDTGYLPIYEGKFGDYIPDIFILPYKTEELKTHDLYINGNYKPGASDSDLIAYDINFYQNGELVDTATLQETYSGILPIQYSINFNVKD